MKLLFAVLAVSFTASNVAQAESTVLFDVKEQCKARQTTQGVRYTPPCTVPSDGFSFSIARDNDNTIGTPALTVTFQCESMRPLSFSYQLSKEGNVISTGELAGSTDLEHAQSIFSLDKSPAEYIFQLTKLNGASGFQAIKPDCKLTIGTGDEEMDFVTLTELTKINIAIRDTASQALSKKSSRFFKNELINNKYWLETMAGLLDSEKDAVGQLFNDTIGQLDEAVTNCGTSYCYTTSINEVETILVNSEQALNSFKQLLDNKLEGYDFGNEEINDEISAWLELRALITERLLSSEDD